MSKKKRVLITGAAGCLGRSLLDFLSDNYDVTGVYHNKSIHKGNYHLQKLDLTHPIVLEDEYDVIIHAAACLQGTASQMLSANCIATQNVIDFAERTRVSKLIYISSVSVFGKCEDVLTESSPINSPEKYGTSKLLGEQLVADSSIPKRFIVRMPRILSKYMDMNADYSGFTIMIKKILNNEDVMCDIAQMPYNNYISSEAICEFIQILINRLYDENVFETVNLGATQELTMGEILEAIKKGLGSTSRILLSEKEGKPKCSRIDISKARRMGLIDRDERALLSNEMNALKLTYSKVI